MSEVTTQDLYDAYKILYSRGKEQTTIKELAEINAQQLAAEDNFLAELMPCPKVQVSKVRDRIANLKSDELKVLTQQQFFNYNVVEALTCLSSAVAYTNKYHVGGLNKIQSIRHWFRDIKQIGTESVEGYAMKASIDGVKDAVILKAPRNPDKDMLSHEIVVGLTLNKLRRQVPNFANVYGGFKCSPPLVDSATKGLDAFCRTSDRNSVNYVLYENIAPAISFAEYLKTATPQQFLCGYMQILNALELAYNQYEFTHYDLHTENVLWRTWADVKNFYIPYGSEYYYTDGVATVIDYGMSHIKVDGQHYGRTDLIPFSIFPNRGWPMHDAYKFLLFCMDDLYRAGNTETFSAAEKVFRYFNRTEDAAKAVEAQWELRFALPLTDKTKNYSLKGLMDYIKKNIKLDFITTSIGQSSNMMACDEGCLSFSRVLDKIGLQSKPQPKNFWEFYDLVGSLQERKETKSASYIAESYDYDNGLSLFDAELSKIETTVNDIIANMKFFDITGIEPTVVLNFESLTMFRRMVENTVLLEDYEQTLNTMKKIGLEVMNVFNDDESVSEFTKRFDDLSSDINKTIRQGNNYISSGNRVLNELVKTQQYQQALGQDRRLEWYGRDRVLIAKV